MDPLMGKSLLSILQGKQRKGHDTLYFHFGSDRALRQGKWKLVSAKLGRWELYDMEADRTEMNDLAKKYPDKVKAMAAEWFGLAENTERLKGRYLKPVKTEVTKLNFRKDIFK
jgi:arylsulfatase